MFESEAKTVWDAIRRVGEPVYLKYPKTFSVTSGEETSPSPAGVATSGITAVVSTDLVDREIVVRGSRSLIVPGDDVAATPPAGTLIYSGDSAAGGLVGRVVKAGTTATLNVVFMHELAIVS